MSWKQNNSPVEFTAYIDFDWYGVDTWGKDEVGAEIAKRTGVNLKVTKGTDLNQLQVLLASDELPDLIFTTNLVERFHDPEVAWPWDELIDQYAPEFRELLDPVEIVNNTVDDGHFYTLKTHYNNEEAWNNPQNLPSPGDPGFFLREDIMQELGNPKLESFEDLMSIFDQVHEKYPDLLVYIPHPTWTNALMDMMGLSKYHYADEDGNVKVSFNDPTFKDYFKFMNELYRKGYMSVESFTYKPEQFLQIVRSGKVFSASYNTALADDTNKIYDENKMDAKLMPLMTALTYGGEQRFKILDPLVGWASFFISKKVKDPARAIQFIEFLKSPEGDALTQWGIEGQHYTKTADGFLQRPEEMDGRKQTETGIGAWYFQASGLGEGIVVSSQKLTNPKYSTAVDLLQFRKQYYYRDPALSFTKPLADTDEFNINVKLTELFTNSQVGIMTAASAEEVEKAYDKMMEDARKIGIEKLETYMTARYKDAKEKYKDLR